MKDNTSGTSDPLTLIPTELLRLRRVLGAYTTQVALFLVETCPAFNEWFDCSVNEIMQQEAMSKHTVRKALISLQDVGLLELDRGLNQHSQTRLRVVCAGAFDAPAQEPAGARNAPPESALETENDEVGEGAGQEAAPAEILSFSMSLDLEDIEGGVGGEVELDPFEAWWLVFPRRIGKEKARTAYGLARKKHKVTDAELLEGAQRYADYVKAEQTETNFICHPTTWLNQGRWQDELVPSRSSVGKEFEAARPGNYDDL